MSDKFSGFTGSLEGPVTGGFAVTPDDNADLSEVTRAIYIGTGGDLAVTLKDGQTVTFSGLSAGALLPARVVRVHASGTTASDILGLV